MTPWPLPVAAATLVGALIAILLVGPRLADVADRLADRTGLGEAAVGAVLVGGATSLAGLVTTAVGSAAGDGGFAVSNALGGIAVQTAFISIADVGLRRVNLEHSAASLSNVLHGALLLTLLSLVLVAAAGPDMDIFAIHPITPVLVGVYLYGLRVTREAHRQPMWRPEQTGETVVDRPAEASQPERLVRLWSHVVVLGAAIGVAGWVIGQAGLATIAATGFTSSEVGTLLTGILTSCPELVVLLAAIRIGAPTLGVANIIGGNSFDAMILPVADLFFRRGSVYHAISGETLFVLGLTLALTSVLTAGLLSRQRRGIGFEGVAIAALYLGGVLTLIFAM